MNILGINSFFEHPAVALLKDGELAFAIEEERLTGIKHGKKYSPYSTYVPFASIYEALRFSSIGAQDITELAYSYDTRLHLRGMLGCLTGRRLSSLREEWNAFRAARNVHRAIRSGYEAHDSHAAWIQPDILGRAYFCEWDHHLCHAASAFFCSGFEAALVVVADGSGEKACTSVYRGQGRTLEKVHQHELPHSLGLFYSFVTRHLGFEAFADEYKVMGLAAYGEPRFKKELSTVLELRQAGEYRVDRRRLQDLTTLLGAARRHDEPLTDVHRDIARSAQELLEAALLNLVSHHLRASGERRLCLAGGTFLNCVANARVAQLPVDDLFVQPAAHDAGTAVGAAVLSSIRRGGETQIRCLSMALGTSYTDREILSALEQSKVRHEYLSDQELIRRIAAALAQNRVGALFRGRMEFGPRALGMRSILASPCREHMREKLNIIKGREQFRPVAPLVPLEAFDTYFEGVANRYMLFTVRAREAARSLAPAAIHVDGTARAQVVDPEHDPFLYAVLHEFGRRTGVPIVINTSFNIRGKPIIEKPTDAIACFCTSSLDFLVLGNRWVESQVRPV